VFLAYRAAGADARGFAEIPGERDQSLYSHRIGARSDVVGSADGSKQRPVLPEGAESNDPEGRPERPGH